MKHFSDKQHRTVSNLKLSKNPCSFYFIVLLVVSKWTYYKSHYFAHASRFNKSSRLFVISLRQELFSIKEESWWRSWNSTPRDQTNSTGFHSPDWVRAPGLISRVSQRITFLSLESHHMIAASSSTGTMGDVVLMPGGCWFLDLSSALGRHVSCLARMLYCTATKLFTPIGTLTVSRKNERTNRRLLLLLFFARVMQGHWKC